MSTQHSEKVGRNELRPCGSRKKYKKCCLPHEQKRLAINRSRTNNVLSDLEYKITDKPLDGDDVRELPEEAQDKLNQFYEEVHINPIACIKDLEVLVDRYPHIPQFSNYLYASYLQTGQIIKANKIVKENYKKHPTYLFALLNYAEHLINKDNIDMVPDVFKDKFDLALLYPERDVFHTSEVISFNGVIGLYYVLIKQKDKAEHCLNILKAISPTHGYTMKLTQELNDYEKFLS